MMKALNTLILGLVFTLSPDAGHGHLVKDVTEFLDQKIDFVGHDNGFRAHITALERDFQELNNLENEAWNHDHVQRVITSLNSAVIVMRRVEDHIISLARTSRTDVLGLENYLNQFKRQVDHSISTDYTYRQIMDTVGSLITDSDDIMRKEIAEINEAESKMSIANAEMRILKHLLDVHEKKEERAETEVEVSSIVSGLGALFAWGLGEDDLASRLGNNALENLFNVYEHKDKFDRVEKNILDCFQYFKREVKLIEKEEGEMRRLKNDYEIIRAEWDGGYHQQELVEVADDQEDWETDVMDNVRNLKRSVNSFVSSAGNW